MGDRRLLAHLGGADLPAMPQGEEFKVPRKIESFPRLEVKDRGEFATRGNAVLPDRFMGAPEGMGSAMPECSVVGEGDHGVVSVANADPVAAVRKRDLSLRQVEPFVPNRIHRFGPEPLERPRLGTPCGDAIQVDRSNGQESLLGMDQGVDG